MGTNPPCNLVNLFKVDTYSQNPTHVLFTSDFVPKSRTLNNPRTGRPFRTLRPFVLSLLHPPFFPLQIKTGQSLTYTPETSYLV